MVSDGHPGQMVCTGKVVTPHLEQREAMSRGSSDGHVKRPSAKGISVMSVSVLSRSSRCAGRGDRGSPGDGERVAGSSFPGVDLEPSDAAAIDLEEVESAVVDVRAGDVYEHNEEWWCLQNRLHRPSEAEDVANVILFLCLPESRQITGQVIHTSAGNVV